MQFRQLRYFVKIVEAGSFSRAASIVHVAQPALSQQIADLEERLGVSLLQRSARGVRPTAAGEILYKEALIILQQLDRLPNIVASNAADPKGTVSLGLIHSLAPKFVVGILEGCRNTLPKVSLKVSDHDRVSLESGIASGSIDLAVLYEDELVASLSRKPLFTQKLYLVSRLPIPGYNEVISLEKVAGLPLVLPGSSSSRRIQIERAFAEAKLKPNVVLEVESLSSAISAVRSDVGAAIFAIGDMSHFGPDAFAKPLLIEPPIRFTCSIVHSADFPLTSAGEAVRNFLVAFIARRIRQPDMPGTEWIAKEET
jgi:LysR family nitrogen assimilation transcriptional regulator